MKVRTRTLVAVATASAFAAAYLMKTKKARKYHLVPDTGANPGTTKKKKKRDGFKDVIALLKQLVPHTKTEMLGLAGYCVIRTVLNDFLARLQGKLFEATFKKDSPLYRVLCPYERNYCRYHWCTCRCEHGCRCTPWMNNCWFRLSALCVGLMSPRVPAARRNTSLYIHFVIPRDTS